MRRRESRAGGGGIRAGVLLVLAVAAAGCTSRVLIPREEYVPGKLLAKSRVYVKGGTQYEFERVSFRPDTLVGEYSVPVERYTKSGNPYYEDEPRVFPMALAEVDSIVVVRRDAGKTFLVGAGIVAGAAFLYTVTNPDLPGSKSTSQPGKPGSGGL